MTACCHAKNARLSQDWMFHPLEQRDGIMLPGRTPRRQTGHTDTNDLQDGRVEDGGGGPTGRLSIVFRARLRPRSRRGRSRRARPPRRAPDPATRRLSRVHLEIASSADAGGYQVHDLGSHNGSALDGAPLGTRPRALAMAA